MSFSIFILFSILIYNQFIIIHNQFIIFFLTRGLAVLSFKESFHRFSLFFWLPRRSQAKRRALGTDEWLKKGMLSSIKRPFVSYLDIKLGLWRIKIMIIAMQTSFPATQRFCSASITYYL